MAIDCGDFPHDSNLTIEVLLRVFYHLKVHTQYRCLSCIMTILGTIAFFDV